GRGHTVELYVNHETSLVPFPFNPTTGVGVTNFTNALLSKLTLERHSAGTLAGSYVIPSEANYQRFCSNFLASHEHGFDRPIIFTNEEATDLVNRTGTAWPPGPNAEQAGLVVAYDVRSGQYRPIYGMGRHNHENSVALEGYGYPVVLSGDDTFSAPSSQLYMYTAANADAVWNDQGTLWAFQSDDPATNDYGDLSGSESVSGRFIPVPRAVAVADQAALENWSNANNVFQFIRVEDIAYDRTDENVVYFADTGEPRALPDPATGRLRRGPSGTVGPWPNGRMFKMVLDPSDPKIVRSLSILVDGDARGAAGAGALDLIHQPDNVETTRDLLLWQEDPGTHNQYPVGTGTTARIWAYDLKRGGAPYVVARVNQSADEGPTDVDSSPTRGLWGSWESSGIVDASKYFGKGAFLLDVEAHTHAVQEEQRGPLTVVREGGQLLLFRLPHTGDHGRHHGQERGDEGGSRTDERSNGKGHDKKRGG
ncbi:MAG: hypothetical protein M3310_03005, partial [Actinomycetota bacterium]|nr:hypothetical protein [Actinomycetota bacterium]